MCGIVENHPAQWASKDAADKIMKRFRLIRRDHRSWSSSSTASPLQILVIQQEAEKKAQRSRAPLALLKSDAKRWNLVKNELSGSHVWRSSTHAHRQQDDAPGIFGDRLHHRGRRDRHRDRQGWVKRQQRVKDLTSTTPPRMGTRSSRVSLWLDARRSLSSRALVRATWRVSPTSPHHLGCDPSRRCSSSRTAARRSVFCFDRRVIELPEGLRDGTPALRTQCGDHEAGLGPPLSGLHAQRPF